MTRSSPPEDHSDLERELAELEPPAITAEQRARLLAIPGRTAQPKLWLPSRRAGRATLTVWAAAAAIGFVFGGAGWFGADESREDQTATLTDDADTELLAELSLPELEEAP